MGRDNGGKKGKVRQGTCIKAKTKKRRGRIEGGRWGWVGQRRVLAGKCRQLYLNNNNKKKKMKLQSQ